MFDLKLEIRNLKFEILRRRGAGQSLVELLLAIGLTSILLPTFILSVVSSRDGKAQQNQRIDATVIMKSTEEIVRNIRNQGWSAFAVDGTFHPVQSGTKWTLAAGADSPSGFTRSIVIADVNRDATGQIATSGGTLDPSTKQVTISLSWSTPYVTTITSVMYLTRYLNNYSVTQTTISDFSPGTATNSAVVATSGSGITNDGQVQLAQGVGNANWCQPQNSIETAFTLPRQGNTLVATQGAAFVGMGNGVSGPTFSALSITNPTPPASPTATLISTYNSTYSTNAIFSDGTYAYLATTATSNQVVILNISTTPYTQIGTINIPGGAAANGIFVDNNIAYVTSGDTLYSYNVTTKTGSHNTPLASQDMWIGIGSTPLAKQVQVVSGYAYVGTADTLFGLQKFKILNGATDFQLVGVSNLTWQQSSQGLFVKSDGTRAYVTFNNGGFFSDGFFIVDTSPADPPSWWPLPNFYNIIGNYNIGSTNPTGMTVVPGNRAIVVGNGGSYEYQVVDITNESNPVFCGGLTIASGIAGIASVLTNNGNAYSYIITGEANNQFKIILGGAGGSGNQYFSSGTYESPTINLGYSGAFNSFVADVAQPASTGIKLQIASAPPNGGSCNNVSYSYVGPNASPSAYFTPNGTTISAAIPLGTFSPNYQNPGQCFRYKAFLSTTNSGSTPALYDFTTNASP